MVTPELGEVCDGAELAGFSCASWGYGGGTLRCTDRCVFDTTGCCGDGKRGAAEACDGTDLGGATCASLGYGAGTLRCGTSCALSTSGCCGDGKRGAGEACDGADLGGKTCASLGFAWGTLACSSGCTLDTSGCCGDGKRGTGEACDGSDLGGKTCASLGYGGGTPGCTAQCTLSTSGCCGDGKRGGTEACDGSDLGGAACASLGYSGGALVCDNQCALNTSGCCGDGKRGTGEVCDGSDLGGATCASLGYGGGTLRCAARCGAYDASDCCGDGKRGPSEVCDGTNLAGKTCASLGFSSGTLACAATCKAVDTSGCWTCGDGKVSGAETCDGKALGGLTCTSSQFAQKGYLSGELACAPGCQAYDETGCLPYKFAYAVASGGGYGGSVGSDIAVDSQGNAYVAGWFAHATTFGTTTLTSKGRSDLLLVKVTPAGQVDWVFSTGSARDDLATAVATDSQGNALVTGYFGDTTAFGSTTLTAAGSQDLFVAKLDSSGKVLWARQAGSSAAYDFGHGVAVDAKDNVYVTGTAGAGQIGFGSLTGTDVSFGPSITIKPSTRKFNGFLDATVGCVFVTKLDPKGTFLWARRVEDTCGGCQGRGIAVTPDGKTVYVRAYFLHDLEVTGTQDGKRTFTTTHDLSFSTSASPPIAIPEVSAALLVKLDTSGATAGQVVWAREVGEELSYGHGGASVAADTAGRAYVAGYVDSATVTVGSRTVTRLGIRDAFAAQLEATGKDGWLTRLSSGVNYGEGMGVAVDTAGTAYVTGTFTYALTLGTRTVTAVGGKDAYVARLDSSGKAVWIAGAGGYLDDQARSLAAGAAGEVFVTGAARSTATFGDITLSAPDRYLFVARLQGGK